jgi:pyruvate,water dikinase
METISKLPTLKDAASIGLSQTGGKAFNLSKVASFGHLIPNGIVIPAELLTKTPISEICRLLPSQLEIIGTGPWAVRSSGIAEDGAEHSFAGQFATVLNVQGNDELQKAIGICLNSASSDQVKAYGGEGRQPLAIIIQEMVKATGILYKSGNWRTE